MEKSRLDCFDERCVEFGIAHGNATVISLQEEILAEEITIGELIQVGVCPAWIAKAFGISFQMPSKESSEVMGRCHDLGVKAPEAISLEMAIFQTMSIVSYDTMLELLEQAELEQLLQKLGK